MTERTVGAALFDMDGTLVDREPLAAQALARACAGRGWTLEPDQVHLLLGRAWQDVYVELGVQARTGWTEAEFVSSVVQNADDLVGEGFELPALPGVASLVEALSGRGVPLAVVTGSTRREVESSLGPLGLLEHFDAVIAAEDYRRGKPAPDCYLAAVEVLGGLPERSVAFEDSTAGVVAARAAGVWVVGTQAANPHRDHPAHQDLSAAHLVVDTLAHSGLLGWVEAAVME